MIIIMSREVMTYTQGKELYMVYLTSVVSRGRRRRWRWTGRANTSAMPQQLAVYSLSFSLSF
jgi:hypothetical protein